MKTKILMAKTYGHSNVLEFVDKPLGTLAADVARVQVKAAGINPIDARRMVGEFRQAPMPQAFGTEFAGVIVELPADANGWAVGDEVLGSGGAFTHATVIDVPMSNLIKRSTSIDWNVAGSLAGAAQTALTILAEIGQVSSLLIHGASGGVGSFTAQLAKMSGIEVVATASAANQDYLRELGVTPVVYGEGLIDRLEQVHPQPFDAAIIMGGTVEAAKVSLERVKPNGFIGSITGIPVSSSRIKSIWSKRDTAGLARFVEGVADGTVKAQVSAIYPFDQARKAYDAVLGGHTRGKSVLTF